MHLRHNVCRVVGADASSDCLLEASRDPTRKRLASSAKLPTRFGLARGPGRAGRSGSFSAGEEALTHDFSNKLLHLSWHPQANVIATAASNSLYLFYGQCWAWLRHLPWFVSFVAAASSCSARTRRHPLLHLPFVGDSFAAGHHLHPRLMPTAVSLPSPRRAGSGGR